MKIKTDRGLILESDDGVCVAIKDGQDQVSPGFAINASGIYLQVLQFKSAPDRYRILIYKSKKDYEQKKKSWLNFNRHHPEVLEAIERFEDCWQELK